MSMLAYLFDEYAALVPENGYWIDFEDGGNGETYCLRCVKKKDSGKEKYSGYGCAAEQDGCLHCSECGKLLDYVLTDHGAEEELHHFKSVKFRRNKPLDRETAYHLARLIAAKPNDIDVIRIAARAIRCMKRIPNGPATRRGER
jgi:hypothetical protein